MRGLVLRCWRATIWWRCSRSSTASCVWVKGGQVDMQGSTGFTLGVNLRTCEHSCLDVFHLLVVLQRKPGVRGYVSKGLLAADCACRLSASRLHPGSWSLPLAPGSIQPRPRSLP